MKKIMIVLLAVSLFTVSSCTKAARINRKLEGTWVATTYDGISVSAGFGYEVTFNKDESESGTGSYEFTVLSVPTGKINFNYTLSEDKLTYTESVSQATNVLTINTYTKDKLEWTDSDGKSTVLEPK